MRLPRALLLHYAILLGLLLGAGLIILFVPGNHIHWIALAFIATTYLIWAIWHHHQDKTLSKDILLEYLALLAIITIVFFLIS